MSRKGNRNHNCLILPAIWACDMSFCSVLYRLSDDALQSMVVHNHGKEIKKSCPCIMEGKHETTNRRPNPNSYVHWT